MYVLLSNGIWGMTPGSAHAIGYSPYPPAAFASGVPSNAGLDLLQAGEHLDREAEALRHRRRGQLSAHHRRGVDRVVVVVTKLVGHSLGLLLAEGVRTGPGVLVSISPEALPSDWA